MTTQAKTRVNIGQTYQTERSGLYCMGLNVSNEQIAQELAVNVSDVQQMTTELRAGIVKKSLP
jgi:hypothetical protein